MPVWVLCSPLPMPRMSKSLPWPKLLTVSDGLTNCSWSTVKTPFLVRSLPVRTVAAIAVFCRAVVRRSAVTTTSCTVSVLESGLAAGAEAAGGGADAVWAEAAPHHPSVKTDALSNNALIFMILPMFQSGRQTGALFGA